MPSKDLSNRADYKRIRATAKSLEEVRQVKPQLPSPGQVTASRLLADKVRRPYTGRLCGNVGPEHRAGGVR